VYSRVCVVFGLSSVHSECHLPLIAFLYAGVVVSPAYIELGEVLCAFESIDQVIDEG
jgi:hypothetical protein